MRTSDDTVPLLAVHAEELGGEGELTYLSALAVGESQLLLCVHSGTGALVWDLRYPPPLSILPLLLRILVPYISSYLQPCPQVRSTLSPPPTPHFLIPSAESKMLGA